VRANPCEGVRSPKSPKHCPRPFRSTRRRACWQPADDDDPVQAARDLAMFELFYSSGLRLAELVGP
jgi:integrase/recombinase XerC